MEQALEEWPVDARGNAESCQVKAFSSGALTLDPNIAEQIHRLAHIDLNLFIRGEQATGKSTAARLVHQQSMRCDLPFVPVLCSTLPRERVNEEIFGSADLASGEVLGFGAAERANGGTLFIDEVGNLPIDCQTRLLETLRTGYFKRIGSDEEVPANFRLIAASDLDVWGLCDAGYLCKDLFILLNECGLDLPPLRERKSRLPEIAADILARLSMQPSVISDDAMQLLIGYSWPGNLRELEFVLETAIKASEGGCITACDLPDVVVKRSSSDPVQRSQSVPSFAGLTLAELEKRAIEDTLRACNGNKAKSARMLGISEKSIYNKMRRLEIQPSNEKV